MLFGQIFRKSYWKPKILVVNIHSNSTFPHFFPYP